MALNISIFISPYSNLLMALFMHIYTEIYVYFTQYYGAYNYPYK